MTTYRVVLAQGPRGNWRLFVALPGRVADWPTEEFAGTAIPSVSARAAALGRLGYRLAAGAFWGWDEDSDTAGGVILLAGAEVQPA
ncbi:DUF6303 family protein [Kitasatospora camelliae]|uniref:DUF6303 family protein n=1 Tax=Kitasatospora camelliae TaxID=3156397 RepID=A0AAU8JWI6_9ACTN